MKHIHNNSASLYNYHVTVILERVNNNTAHADNQARDAKIRQRRTYFPVRNPIVLEHEGGRRHETAETGLNAVGCNNAKKMRRMDDEEKRAPAAV